MPAYAPVLVSVIFSNGIQNENDLWEKVRNEIGIVTPIEIIWKKKLPPPSRFISNFGIHRRLHFPDRRFELDVLKKAWERYYFDGITLYQQIKEEEEEWDNEEADEEEEDDEEETDHSSTD